MIAPKTLKLSLKSLRDFAKKRLPDETLIELDERDECPLEVVRHMCSPDKLGIQLLFVPEEYGGFGGGGFFGYCMCAGMGLRCLLRVGGDGPYRPRRRHVGAGHVPGQRPDHSGRHARAEEDLADAD